MVRCLACVSFSLLSFSVAASEITINCPVSEEMNHVWSLDVTNLKATMTVVRTESSGSVEDYKMLKTPSHYIMLDQDTEYPQYRVDWRLDRTNLEMYSRLNKASWGPRFSCKKVEVETLI